MPSRWTAATRNFPDASARDSAPELYSAIALDDGSHLNIDVDTRNDNPTTHSNAYEQGGGLGSVASVHILQGALQGQGAGAPQFQSP